jgi:diacylglycerol kinase family enzyme
MTAYKIVALLRKHGYDPRYVSSKSGDLDQSLKEPGEFIAVAGGDGTVGKIAMKLARKNVALAIIPAGTANNIATSLGVSGNPDAIISSWSHARSRSIDIATVAGRWGEQRFIESFGVGLFAATIRNMEPMHEPSQHRFQTQREEFQHAYREMKRIVESTAPRHCAIAIDGQDYSGEYVLAETMNIASIGPNLCLAPEADSGDGKLDVVLVSAQDRERFCTFLSRRLKEYQEPPEISSIRASLVVVDPKGAPVHVDDELHSESHKPLEPPGPVQITACCEHATFLLP